MFYNAITMLMCLIGQVLASPIPTRFNEHWSGVLLDLVARNDPSAGTHVDTMAIVGIIAGVSVLFVLIGALVFYGRQGKW